MSIPRQPFEPLEARRLLTTAFPVTLGSLAADQANSVAADSANNVYVVGTLGGTTDFDPSAGTANLSAGGFVAKYASDGSLVWARQFIGADPRKVSVDRVGNVYVAGGFTGTVDFDPRRAVNNVTSIGGTDAFVMTSAAAATSSSSRRSAGSARTSPPASRSTRPATSASAARSPGARTSTPAARSASAARAGSTGSWSGSTRPARSSGPAASAVRATRVWRTSRSTTPAT